MLAKVWRDNQFTGAEGRVSGNDGRGFCQVCDLVSLTTCRGESLLKAYEKISVGWSVQRYSSFEIVIVRPLQRSITNKEIAEQHSSILVICLISWSVSGSRALSDVSLRSSPSLI